MARAPDGQISRDGGDSDFSHGAGAEAAVPHPIASKNPCAEKLISSAKSI
jgi:hypothetical protein